MEALAMAMLPQADADGTEVLPLLHHLMAMLPGSACPALMQSMAAEVNAYCSPAAMSAIPEVSAESAGFPVSSTS